MKSNEATVNRPEGSRLIDAPYLTFDLKEKISMLKDEKAWEDGDRNAITLFKTDKLTVVLSCLRKEVELPDNSIDGILTVQVLDGKINLTTDVESIELCEHKLFTLHANINHTIHALKDSVLLLTTYNEA